MGAKMAHLSRDIGNLEPIHQGESPCIEGSQRLGSSSNAHLAGIFPQADIASIMQPLLDPPMGVLEGQQASGVGVLPGQVGEPIQRLLPLFVGVFHLAA